MADWPLALRRLLARRRIDRANLLGRIRCGLSRPRCIGQRSATARPSAPRRQIGTSAAPSVLAYLFHRVEGRLDGRPTLLIVDEGWLALDDPTFGAQLREWLKTLRKKNASVVFATQSLADIDNSAIAPAIIESCPTRLFLPNERAIEPQIMTIYRRFGLNDRQIEILARATPKRDYYCQSRRGNRLFELGLGEVALAFTAASSKADQATIADLVAEHGRAGFAAAWLRARGSIGPPTFFRTSPQRQEPLTIRRHHDRRIRRRARPHAGTASCGRQGFSGWVPAARRRQLGGRSRTPRAPTP